MLKWAAIFLASMLALGMLTGCSKKENTNEEQGTSPSSEVKPAGSSAPIDPATAAKISGTVSFDGTAPKPSKIDMSQDPACKGNNTSETMVVDSGKLANVFVYVKDGMGDRSFEVPKDSVTIDQKGCQYHPHVLGVMTNQNIEIRNETCIRGRGRPRIINRSQARGGRRGTEIDDIGSQLVDAVLQVLLAVPRDERAGRGQTRDVMIVLAE